MKKYGVYVVVFFLISSIVSCKKKEGCRDVNALNFDSSAEKDGNCSYTKALFYAPSNRIGGVVEDVVKIEIYLGPTPGEQLIGTIATFGPTETINCAVTTGIFEYELPGSEVEYIFITRYYYDNNTDEFGDSHLLKADKNKNCETVRLTL